MKRAIDFNTWCEAREMQQNIIKAGDPVRNSVSSIETYWDKPGAAISQIAAVLQQYGYIIDDVISFNDSLPEYRATYNLSLSPDPHNPWVHRGSIENMLVFSWYKMQSGRYEVNAYIS